ncbi:hypothetical protein RSAG8_03590, partial [Rhizoctonia solani AG-8 WAC10335]
MSIQRFVGRRWSRVLKACLRCGCALEGPALWRGAEIRQLGKFKGTPSIQGVNSKDSGAVAH